MQMVVKSPRKTRILKLRVSDNNCKTHTKKSSGITGKNNMTDTPDLFCPTCGMGEVFESLSEGERHCWNEGESHYNANIDKIEQESQHDINKINAELRKDIQEAIQAKYDTEYKKQLAKETRSTR